MNFLLTLLILTYEFDILTNTINCKITCLSQCLKNVYLLITNIKHTWPVYLSKYRNLIVRHTHSNYWILCRIQIRKNLVVNHLLTH